MQQSISEVTGAAAAQAEETKQPVRSTAPQSAAASQAQLPENSQITLGAKFISGLKADVTDNIFFLDDNQVVYPSGHNIVIYHLEDKTQKAYPCIEGTEGISSMAISHNRRTLAVAEKSDKTPIVTIYRVDDERQSNEDRKTDGKILKKRKIICSTEIKQHKSFVSMAFCPKNEKLLVTLSSEPEQTVYIWQVDKQRCVTKQTMSHPTGHPIGTQVSFSLTDQNVILVTGNQTYKYYIKKDEILAPQVRTIAKKEYSHISQNYTAHCWLSDGRILVGTDQGQIILCEPNGEVRRPLNDYPGDGFYIEKILTYQRGFIIVGDKGQIMVYLNTGEPNNLFQQTAALPNAFDNNMSEEQKQIVSQVVSSSIKSVDLNSQEDTLIFTTDNNQIYKMAINLLDNRNVEAVYEYLVHPFHSRPISGMDVCIKKDLIATCSSDKTVKIWQYSPSLGYLELKINQQFPDDAMCVAFHPAGFQIVVGFFDRIRMMNVFQDSIQQYKDLPIKQCREIVFSNGGHLFACMFVHLIHVYNFYTAQNPLKYTFKAHSGPIRSIAWLQDDTGFVSSALDTTIYFWTLNPKEGEQNPVWDHMVPSVDFTCLKVFKPDGEKSSPSVFATGQDKTIREIKNGKEICRFEQSVNLNQIEMMFNGRAFFTGVNEANKPGSVQVVMYPFTRAKIFEIQAHAQMVTRIRLSYDNQYLYTAGADGTLAVLQVQDKLRDKRELPTMSQEILIKKKLRDELQTEIRNLQESIRTEERNRQEEQAALMQKYKKKTEDLTREMEEKELEGRQKMEKIEQETRDMERRYQEEINRRMDEHRDTLEKKAQDQSEKREADLNRYQELKEEKEQDLQKFEMLMSQTYITHENLMEELNRDQILERKKLESQKKELSLEIERMVKTHKEKREQVENQTWESIETIKEKNKQELAQEVDKGMKQKSELTLIRNEYREREQDMENMRAEIAKQNQALNTEIANTSREKQHIESMKNELQERERTIIDKQMKIDQYRKQTQELEKFKFVLDYKIKELKSRIGPRMKIIQGLQEQKTKMDNESKHFFVVNENLRLIVKDMKLKREGMQKELAETTTKMRQQEDIKQQFKDEVYEVLNNHLNDYKKLKKGIKRLHRIYVLNEANKNEIGETDLHEEHNEMRRSMEKNIEHMRRSLKKGKQIHADAYQRIQGQNVMLLRDINILRKEEVNILLQKHMFTKLYRWTKQRLGNVQSGQEDDELMETSDQRDQMLDLNAEIEDMDMEIEQLAYQQQEVESRVSMLKQMQQERMLQRQAQQEQQQAAAEQEQLLLQQQQQETAQANEEGAEGAAAPEQEQPSSQQEHPETVNKGPSRENQTPEGQEKPEEKLPSEQVAEGQEQQEEEEAPAEQPAEAPPAEGGDA